MLVCTHTSVAVTKGSRSKNSNQIFILEIVDLVRKQDTVMSIIMHSPSLDQVSKLGIISLRTQVILSCNGFNTFQILHM